MVKVIQSLFTPLGYTALLRLSILGAAVSGGWIAGGQTLPSVTDPQKIVRDASWNELHAPKAGPLLQLSATQGRLERHRRQGNRRNQGRGCRSATGERRQSRCPPTRNRQNATGSTTCWRTLRSRSTATRRSRKTVPAGDEMVRMLPDAFLYTLAGTVEGPERPLLPPAVQAESCLYAAGP